MSEKAGHTPGPWVTNKFGTQVLTGDSWSVICVLKGEAFWEDGRGRYEQAFEWQNQLANALLIAAAPEMLEALKAEDVADQAEDAHREHYERADAEDWLNDPTGSLHVSESMQHSLRLRQKAVEMRRAAIAKATGEP